MGDYPVPAPITYAVYLKNQKTEVSVFQHAVVEKAGLEELLTGLLGLPEAHVEKFLREYEESGQNTFITEFTGNPYFLTVVRADRGL